jgi:hypothetical protein
VRRGWKGKIVAFYSARARDDNVVTAAIPPYYSALVRGPVDGRFLV